MIRAEQSNGLFMRYNECQSMKLFMWSLDGQWLGIENMTEHEDLGLSLISE